MKPINLVNRFTNEEEQSVLITISDVAAKAGVSRTTVSYVLNEGVGSLKISDPTRVRVLEAATQLGYRRNELARAVTTGKTQMLGFWVMQSNREPVVRVLAGAMKEAEQSGYSIKMLGFDNGSLPERILERCQEWRLSGILAIHAPGDALRELYSKILGSAVPFVVVDSQQPPPGCTHIVADSKRGMSEVIEHLVELGHQRIAFLGSRRADRDAISGNRERAYRAVMKSHHLTEFVQIEYGDWEAQWNDWENGTTAAAAQRLLQSTPRPTAIACASDYMAMVVVRLASDQGLRVPQQLSVTGFDDVTAATLYVPPLTTVAQPFEEMGSCAVRHLIAPDKQFPQVLPAHLVVRGSTARPEDAGDSDFTRRNTS